jgi:hypothetical protein
MNKLNQDLLFRSNYLKKLQIMGKIEEKFYSRISTRQTSESYPIVVWIYIEQSKMPSRALILRDKKAYNKSLKSYEAFLEQQKSKVIQKIKSLNLSFTSRVSLPFLFSKMTKAQMLTISKMPQVKSIGFYSKKVKLLMDNVVPSMSVNTFHYNSYWGMSHDGVKIPVVIIENGRPSNSFLPNNIVVRVPSAPTSGNYQDSTNHVTRVAGIIASQKTGLLGVAPSAQIKVANFNCPISLQGNINCQGNEISDSFIWAKNQGPAIWNLSIAPLDNYGQEPWWRLYIEYLAAYHFVLPVIGSGNITNYQVSDCVNFPLSCQVKNNIINGLVVGAIDDKNTVLRSDDSIHPVSSWINLSSGREFPHIAFPGVNIKSLCFDASNSNCNDLDNNSNGYTGTSFSTPGIAGLAALITSFKHYDFTYWPEVVRAIILASAHYDSDNYVYQGTNSGSDAKDGAGVPDGYLAYLIVSGGQYNQPLLGVNHGYDFGLVSPSSFPLLYETIFIEPGKSINAAVVWMRNVNCSSSTPTPTTGCEDYAANDDIDLKLECSNGTSWVLVKSSSSFKDNWEKFQYSNTGSDTKFCRLRVEKQQMNSTNVFLGVAWGVLETTSNPL